MTANAPRRADLLELSTEALTALANPGFVKKAIKDVEAGQAPRIEEDADGTVHAHHADGTHTTLPTGRTLREAACSCPATSMCRHRVMLVLAYQAQAQAREQAAVPSDALEAEVPAEAVAATETTPWSPAHFDDAHLSASLSGLTLTQALRLAQARPVAAVEGWSAVRSVPGVRLPMCTVRFFSRTALVHARCDCREGSGCAHVALAVWAFRQAEQQQPGVADVVVELRPPVEGADAAADSDAARTLTEGDAARALRAEIDAWLQALWLDGSAQPLMALEARLARLRSQCDALGWRWVAESLEEVWQMLQAQQARSSRFDPLQLLQAVADLWARPEAAVQAARTPSPPLPARQILGVGVRGEVPLDHLKLVSLGIDLWTEDAAEGADLVLADTDTQTLMVLQRRWPRTEAAASAAAPVELALRRVGSQPLRQLAASQIVTKAAARRANGAVEITFTARQTNVFPLSPLAWDALGSPLRQTRLAELAALLRTVPPDFVRPRQLLRQFHVVAPASLAVQGWGWDAATQTLHAVVGPAESEDEAGLTLSLHLPHRAHAPGAVDALAAALQGEWGGLRALAGPVWLAHGQLHMEPLALLAEQRAVVLQTEPARAQALAAPPARPPSEARQQQFDQVLDLLAQWLRRGLRHVGPSAVAQGHALARDLSAHGLVETARQVEAAVASLRTPRQAQVPGQLARLVCLVQALKQG